MVTVFLSCCRMHQNYPLRYAQYLFPGCQMLSTLSECKNFVGLWKASFITSLCAWRVTGGRRAGSSYHQQSRQGFHCRWVMKPKDRLHEVHAEYDGPGECQAALQGRKVTLSWVHIYARAHVPAASAQGCVLSDVLCAMQWEHPLRAESLR